MKLGIISDTHGHMDDRIAEHLSSCDVIWHAGDIGDGSITDHLARVAPTKAVYGNIDGPPLRARYPEHLFEVVEGVPLLMIHIAGPFGRYHPKVRTMISKLQPQVLICGHSHILKVAFDHRHQLLYLNPGAAGRNGFHKVRTLLRVDIDEGKLSNCEAVELGLRSAQAVH